MTRKKAKTKAKRRKKPPRKKPAWPGSARIKQLREEHGWSLSQLSGEIYAATRGDFGPGIVVPPQSLHQYERGSEPLATAFIGLCRAFDIDPEDLVRPPG